uniref:Uncharacterized protein n=1 Tax=Cacopsylla melanoneura TaxID=428564 RepID=A0A8D8RL99_9HEMI
MLSLKPMRPAVLLSECSIRKPLGGLKSSQDLGSSLGGCSIEPRVTMTGNLITSHLKNIIKLFGRLREPAGGTYVTRLIKPRRQQDSTKLWLKHRPHWEL